ncbi:hypothetical protein ACN2C7_18355 [Caulobacter sp. ErkDOM-E]|uniref:hypothetical protein n=1 Tax=Caulobacter sp. ErkDOM-E TaxID=3402778 RepID=UPI003AF6699A
MAEEHVDASFLYNGQPILGDDAFLRRLPAGFSSEEKIRFEALVFISDTLTWAFQAIRLGALRCAERGIATTCERAELFAAAWSIVDSVHAARTIINTIAKNGAGPKTRDFIESTSDFTLLRNDMDHLDQKVAGLAGAKGHRRPLFGALSFFYSKQSDLIEGPNGPHLSRGASIIISAGAPGAAELMPLSIPRGEVIAFPIDLFRLSAFKYEILLAPPIAKFAGFIRHLNESVEESVKRQAMDHVEKNGGVIEDVMNSNPFGMIIRAEIEFPLEYNVKSSID